MIDQELSQKARDLIAARLERAVKLNDADLFAMNLNLPLQYKYGTIREVQTVMVKGAFDALAFTVELGLLQKEEATGYWKELHQQFSSLWPEPSAGQ